MDQPSQYPERVRVTRKREETVAESNLLFWLWRPGVGGVREGSATPRRRARGAPASRPASGQQPEPEPRGSPGCGERSSCCALGQQLPGRLRSQGAAADQLRPAGHRLPAPPRPPGTRARAPAPGGGEGGSGAPGWGPRLPSRLPLSPGSALRDEPPATPQSQRGDSGEWAPWRCPSSRSAPCPGWTERRQAQSL